MTLTTDLLNERGMMADVLDVSVNRHRSTV